jgi:hypothetical protein
MRLKVFSQKFVGMVGFPAISPNGMGICAVRPSKNNNQSTALNQAYSIYTVL